MSALEHPDAAWYHPNFFGRGAKIGEDAAGARAGWGAVTMAGALRPGHAAFRIMHRPDGASQLHYVNAIDPGTAGDWLLPGVQLDDILEPARLPI